MGYEDQQGSSIFYMKYNIQLILVRQEAGPQDSRDVMITSFRKNYKKFTALLGKNNVVLYVKEN